MNSIDPFPTTIEDQKELIDRINAGCTESFAKLTSVFGPRIFRRILYEVGNLADAEDLTQDTLCAVKKGLSNFHGHAKLSTWIYGIITNKINAFRRFWSARKRDKDCIVSFEALRSNDGVQSNSFDPSDPHCDQPFDRLLKEEAEAEVRNAIDSLQHPKQKEAIELFYLQSMEYEEIAEAMNEKIGSVKGWLNRAKIELKEKLCEADEATGKSQNGFGRF